MRRPQVVQYVLVEGEVRYSGGGVGVCLEGR